MMKDAPDGVEEFAHDGDDGLLGFLAAREQCFVAGLDLCVAADGDQGWQKESRAQVDIAGFAQAPGLVHRGAGLERSRIQAGVRHPLRGFESFGQHEQFAQDPKSLFCARCRARS